jgi:hypothetical protein
VDAAPSYKVDFAAALGASKPPDTGISQAGAVSLMGWAVETSRTQHYVEAAGVPFLCSGGALTQEGGSLRVEVGHVASKLYLVGFTCSFDQGETGWCDPNDRAHQIFIGDELGKIVIDYKDGQSDSYPLIYGYSAWWDAPLRDAPEPFQSSADARKILASSLSLLPTGAGTDGAYLGVITCRPEPIRDLHVVDNPDRAGVPVFCGLTMESTEPPAGLQPLPHDTAKDDAQRWLDTHSLIANADTSDYVQQGLKSLRSLLYTTLSDFPTHLPVVIPPRYQGPRVTFEGDVYADILTSMFYANVQDIVDKVDGAGMYHTSTKGAPSWGGYTGIGTWQDGAGEYYGHSWSRDMGRSLQELTDLGFLAPANRCADYCFREARRWATDPSLKYKGVQLPPHWSRIVNIPTPVLGSGVFENDGQGLLMLFTYKLWQREADPGAWLRTHWNDVEAAGDWSAGQRDHPETSGAGPVLETDSECAGGIGHAKYADNLCMEALRAYASMATSIGQSAAAARWISTASRLKAGMEKTYFDTDPALGPTWTLLPAGWPNRSTNLGPLITLADRRGFAPADDDPTWRDRNLNAYLRLTHSYQPFGFYGVAMGYGQGFVTEAALLLDRMKDAGIMLQWLARATYYSTHDPYIVPEGCEMGPDGTFWRRTGDLGNGVQEAEAVKVMRLVIGVDDNDPASTMLIPRLPEAWTSMSVDDYPLLTRSGNANVLRHVAFDLHRTDSRLQLRLHSDGLIASLSVRLGPFSRQPAHVVVDGRTVTARMEHSGDSWWAWLPALTDCRQLTAEVN